MRKAEKIISGLTFKLLHILFKLHGKELMMMKGTGKDTGKYLIYMEDEKVQIQLQNFLENAQLPKNEENI